MENIERFQANVNGLRLNTFASNEDFAEKLPVVLVQGLGISASYMIPTMSEMAKFAKVFTFDLPGFGDSEKPWHVFNIAELADVLAEWMSVARIERAVLVGHSFGSQIVTEFALRHPARIASAVLAAPTFERRARTFFRQFGRFLLNARNEPFSLVLLAVKSYLKFGFVRETLTLRYALADRIEEKLPQIHVPALVLRGELDTIVPQRWAEEVAALLPDGKSVTIGGGTHGVNYNSPQKFAEAIREFLGY
ncbi:MAG TPA: alpha/beta hydrolase [Pyrinomonadaceae bacterium]|jgi:pimeloyl-ACP methyl ester carboxylesterase